MTAARLLRASRRRSASDLTRLRSAAPDLGCRHDSATRWVSWREASELTGIPVPTIDHAVSVGRIARRESRGSRPTLDLASVEQWAGSYSRQLLVRKVRSTRGRTDTKRIVRPYRESVDEQWLTTAEAAALRDVCEDSVRRMARRGQLESRREERWLVHRDAVAAHLAEEANGSPGSRLRKSSAPQDTSSSRGYAMADCARERLLGPSRRWSAYPPRRWPRNGRASQLGAKLPDFSDRRLRPGLKRPSTGRSG